MGNNIICKNCSRNPASSFSMGEEAFYKDCTNENIYCPECFEELRYKEMFKLGEINSFSVTKSQELIIVVPENFKGVPVCKVDIEYASRFIGELIFVRTSPISFISCSGRKPLYLYNYNIYANPADFV